MQERPGRITSHDALIIPITRLAVASCRLSCEPLAGKRLVRVSQRRTKKSWAYFMWDPIEGHYPEAGFSPTSPELVP
jgi:hypothetical protein